MEEPSDQYLPLDHPATNQEVETDWRPAVGSQEGHQESKSNEDHHMHILETRIQVMQALLYTILGIEVFRSLGIHSCTESSARSIQQNA